MTYVNEQSEREAARMRIVQTLDCDMEQATKLEELARAAAKIDSRPSAEVFETIIRSWEKMGERYVDKENGNDTGNEDKRKRS